MLNSSVNSAEAATARSFRMRASALAAQIGPGAAERELNRELPFEAFRLFKASGLGIIRLPAHHGGANASVKDVMQVVSELAAAEPNVAQALRSHFNFVELQITSVGGIASPKFLTELQKGAIFGGAHTEIGTKRPGDINTKLERAGDRFVLNGRKYYATGTAFSDWVSVSAMDSSGTITWVLLPTDRPGVVIKDDWNGMGQRLTASGGVDFIDVPVEAEEISGRAESSLAGRHASTFRQLYLASCVAGIVRNIAAEAVNYVQTKARPITHSHAQTARDDFFIQEAVGTIAALSAAVDSLLMSAADTVDDAHQAILDENPQASDMLARSSVEVAKTQIVSGDLALQAAQRMFDTGGASATSRSLNFDRHWRNIRTLLSHNPVAYKKKIVGDYLLNGIEPPTDGGFF